VSADARVFRLQLALGGAGVLAAMLALGAGARTVHVTPDAAHRLDLAGLRFTYPAVNAAAAVLLAFAALGAAVLMLALGAAVRQARAHRRLMRALPVFGVLPAEPAVTVLDATTPLAFCAGWLRPRVYVSRGALERLPDEQLRAVLAHEHHHRALRDPLRLAAGRVLSQALFFLPVLRPLSDRYGDAAELAADAAAVRASGGAAGPLAAAMLSLAAGPSGDVVGISPDRVDSLLGRPPAWRAPRLALTAGLVTLAGLLALIWRASAGATVAATLNLPIASSQPCILVLALLPVVACLIGVLSRRAT
jgi:hypothetical protein